MNVVILTLINKRTTNMWKEVSYKDLKFNPFRLIGDEWMLVTAGNEKDGCNTMTASWVIGTGTLIHSFGSMNLSLVI